MNDRLFLISKIIIVYNINAVCVCLHEAEWRECAQVLAAMVHLVPQVHLGHQVHQLIVL